MTEVFAITRRAVLGVLVPLLNIRSVKAAISHDQELGLPP